MPVVVNFTELSKVVADAAMLYQQYPSHRLQMKAEKGKLSIQYSGQMVDLFSQIDADTQDASLPFVKIDCKHIASNLKVMPKQDNIELSILPEENKLRVGNILMDAQIFPDSGDGADDFAGYGCQYTDSDDRVNANALANAIKFVAVHIPNDCRKNVLPDTQMECVNFRKVASCLILQGMNSHSYGQAFLPKSEGALPENKDIMIYKQPIMAIAKILSKMKKDAVVPIALRGDKFHIGCFSADLPQYQSEYVDLTKVLTRVEKPLYKIRVHYKTFVSGLKAILSINKEAKIKMEMTGGDPGAACIMDAGNTGGLSKLFEIDYSNTQDKQTETIHIMGKKMLDILSAMKGGEFLNMYFTTCDGPFKMQIEGERNFVLNMPVLMDRRGY